MKRFSQIVSVFHERVLPEEGCSLAGYAALINAYELKIPLPEKCAAISSFHKRYDTNEWAIYTPRYKPEDTLAAHLTFALKYEAVDFTILAALFAKINPEEITVWVHSEPVGRYSRRIWFFYEWLTEKNLALDDAKTGNLVDALDEKKQYPGKAIISKRHRVRNNLPGVQAFCPLVRRTEKLEQYINLHLNAHAKNLVQKTSHDLLTRAAAFLVLKDSRASFQIENEYPEQERAERWGQALSQAGMNALTKDELLRLQKIILEKNRFITLGFRHEGGFIGIHDRFTNTPIPDHISARWQDIEHLLDGMLTMYEQQKMGLLDPVILAAALAFGFVFIHPFVDGNGRMHRYLIQHVLAETGFVPQGIVFPLSAVILKQMEAYKAVLEAYSHPRLACIEWRSTPQGNVEVLNETNNLYRYFDATKQAEFLYECFNEAVTQSFVEEIDYLKRYDQFKNSIKQQYAMSDYLANLLIRFLEQNNGVFSKRAKNDHFKTLTPDECQHLEQLYAQIFKS